MTEPASLAITDLAVKVSGSLALNRREPEHVERFRKLTLGHFLKVECEVEIVQVATSVKETFNGERKVRRTATLRVHSVEPVGDEAAVEDLESEAVPG